jgi:hypothetical protein
MVQLQSRYSHLAFERIFSDVPFLRSLRHKIQNFMGTSRKKERKKKTRVGLHKCFASHRIKKLRITRFILHAKEAVVFVNKSFMVTCLFIKQEFKQLKSTFILVCNYLRHKINFTQASR